jgi:hypothetical protein
MSAPPTSGEDENILLGQVMEVACGRGFRCTGDGHVLLGTHAALEAVGAFLQHAAKNLHLPVGELLLPRFYQLIGSGRASNVSRLEMGIGSLPGSSRNSNDL